MDNLVTFIKNNWLMIFIVILFIIFILKHTGLLKQKNVSSIKNHIVYSNNNDSSEEKSIFIESRTFNGEKKGYVFKTDSKGTGYYIDKTI